MSQDASRVVEFHARVTVETSGRVHVPLPFDPDDAWGSRPRHHVTGTLDGHPLRGVVAPGPGSELVLGPSWCHGWRPASDAVAVVVSEQSGSISIAHAGRMIRRIDPERLENILAAFFRPDTTTPQRIRLQRYFPYLFRKDE